MKKGKIFIIIFVFILVICAIFTCLYFTTDILKSNKKLFNKYIFQLNLENLTDFKNYENYSKRMLNEPHTNEGTLSIKYKEDVDELFDFKTKSNLDKKAASGEISFNQNGEEKLKVSYLKDNNWYALQCIYQQYMALKEEDLSEFGEKFGIDLDALADRLDSLKNENGEIDFNKEEKELEELVENIKKVAKKYLNIIIEEIPEESYSKIKNEEIKIDEKTIKADGYTLTLTQKDILKIAKNVISKAKDDEELYKIFKTSLEKNEAYQDQDFTFENYQDMIENFESLTNLNNEWDNTLYDTSDDESDHELDDILETLANNSETQTNSDDEVDTSRIYITVYKQANKFKKLSVKMVEDLNYPDEYIDFSIENNNLITINNVYGEDEKNSTIIRKSTSDEGEQIRISYTGTDFSGDTSNAVLSFLLKNNQENKYETSLNLDLKNSEDNTLNIKYNNITEFKDNIEVEKFENIDSVDLNTLTKEHIELIANDLGERITQKIDFEKTLIGALIMFSDNGIISRATEAKKLYIEGEVRDEITLAIFSAKVEAENQAIENPNFSAATDLGINKENSDIYKAFVKDLTTEKGFTVVPSEGKLAVTYETDEYKRACNNNTASIEIEITVSGNSFSLTNEQVGLIANDLDEGIEQKIDFNKAANDFIYPNNNLLNRSPEEKKLQLENEVKDIVVLAVFSAKVEAENQAIENPNFSAATDLGTNGENSDIYKAIIEDLSSERGFTVVPSQGKLAVTYETDVYKQVCNNDTASIKVDIIVSGNSFEMGEYTFGKITN